MPDEKKNILILGAGFAGIRAALRLSKKLPANGWQITIIDEHDTHVYTPDLYEIATAFNEEINEECLVRLKDTVAIPYSKIFTHKHTVHAVKFVRDRVLEIQPHNKKVLLKNRGELSFDYCVIALGSVVNYYNITGLQEFSYPLKTLTDALAINCHLDMYIHNLWKQQNRCDVHIVIGGGGATGVEFASELYGDIDKICKKYSYPHSHVKVTLVEGSEKLAGQDPRATRYIMQRLKKLGVDFPINYLKEDPVAAIRKLRGEKGLDIIYDNIGGRTFRNLSALLCPGGRIAGYGAAERLDRKGPFATLGLVFGFGFFSPVKLLVPSKTMAGINMLRIADHRPELLQHCLQETVKLAAEGKIHPVNGGEFPVSEIGKAHALLESRKSTGKIIVRWKQQ